MDAMGALLVLEALDLDQDIILELTFMKNS